MIRGKQFGDSSQNQCLEGGYAPQLRLGAGEAACVHNPPKLKVKGQEMPVYDSSVGAQVGSQTYGRSGS